MNCHPSPEDWSPCTLQVCVDSPALGYLTGMLSLAMLLWYSLIAYRWLESAKYASQETKQVWHWLIIIFLLCGSAGYGSWFLALWVPKAAVILRITAIVVLNIACPMFLLHSTHRRFLAMSKHEHLGDAIENAVLKQKPDADDISQALDDRELASLCRQLVSQSLQRARASE